MTWKNFGTSLGLGDMLPYPYVTLFKYTLVY